jgi:hypothetical protein
VSLRDLVPPPTISRGPYAVPVHVAVCVVLRRSELAGLQVGISTQTTEPMTGEPMTGIEPAYSAWEADVLPLNYIGAVAPEG